METPKLKRTKDFKLPMGVLGMSAINSDESFVAACMDGVYRVDLTNATSEKLDAHDSYVSSAEVLEGVAVTAGYDGNLQWFDLGSRERIRRIKLHDFWSWDMTLSPDKKLIASVSGQYLAGGYKYEPKAAIEPLVKIVSADSGELLHAFDHVPSVQSVAFSHDSRHVAAGNLMGEVRVWDVQSGEQVGQFTTPDFTSWGIIKSHCYLGGIFALQFTADDEHLLLAGMGEMRDPMAGNGKQLWQKWKWNQSEPAKVDQTHKDEAGEGLMETLALSVDGTQFAMGGRLRGGEWNVAIFDTETGDRRETLKTGYRVTQARFDGDRLVLVGSHGQPSEKKDDRYPDFGVVEMYQRS